MEYIEAKILAHLSKGWKLFKNTEQTLPSYLEDVKSFLKREVIKEREQLAKASARLEVEPNNTYLQLLHSSTLTTINKIEELIENIKNSHSFYYLIEVNYGTPWKTVTPIGEKHSRLYEAFYDDNKIIQYRDINDPVGLTLYTIPSVASETKEHVTICMDTFNGRKVHNTEDFKDFTGVYTDKVMAKPGHYCSCRECGELFFISIAELADYRTKDFEYTCRCQKCREKRYSETGSKTELFSS